MNDNYNVTIVSEGESGKIDVFEGHADSIISASRMLMTLRLKRGYKIVKVDIERGLFYR